MRIGVETQASNDLEVLLRIGALPKQEMTVTEGSLPEKFYGSIERLEDCGLVKESSLLDMVRGRTLASYALTQEGKRVYERMVRSFEALASANIGSSYNTVSTNR